MTVRDEAPAGSTATRVEFTLTDPTYPFVRISRLFDDCRALLEELIPRGDGNYAEFFTITGGDEDRIMEIADSHGSLVANVLDRFEGGELYEFLVEKDCPIVFLAKHGALPRDAHSVDGEGRIVAEIPGTKDGGNVVDTFLDAHPDAELSAKLSQSHVSPMFSRSERVEMLDGVLTDRQAEVLSLANDAGYYDWPRECTASELADAFDVSEPTLHKHLRAAERNLVAAFFDGAGPDLDSRDRR